MDRITLYIGKTILVAILLAMTLFVGLEIIFSFVNEARHIGTGQYTLWPAISFVLLLLPNHIAEMFPMSALVGTIMGLGLLASRSELIVMRAAGLSRGDIIVAVSKLAIILIVFTWILSEWVAPITDRSATNQKALALSSGQALRTAHGTWMRDGNHFIHIQSIESNDALSGITRYELNDKMELLKASYARSAHYVNDHWVLRDIKETVFEPGKTQSHHIAKSDWISSIDPSMVNLVAVKDLAELSLVELWQTIRYRQANGLNAKDYQLEFWQKICRPFATLVMMFLAIPFIFGPLRSATMGLRMLVAVLVGFVFYTVNQLFGPLTLVYAIPPIVGAVLPTGLFFIVGLVLLKRSEGN
ncbi:MAG: LPS export ABC transporter permease LptG [Candidatus Berkiellales bacterium]